MMNLDLAQHLPEDFDPSSKVWIYQSSRLFQISEALEMEEMLNNFVKSWESHGAPVKGYANLFFGRFIVLMADESEDKICGRSADSSVRLIKDIATHFNVDLLNRQLLSFFVKDKIEQLPLTQLPYAIEHSFINADSLFFDNTVSTKAQLLKEWIVPAAQTWIKRYFVNQPL